MGFIQFGIGGIFGIGVILLVLYIYLLERRSKIPPASNRIDFLHSIESVIPFLALGIGLGAVRGLDSVKVLSLLILIVLSITLIRLPRLRYMAAATILVMLVIVGVVAGQALNMLWDTLDVFPVLPSALGHPKTGADLENVVRLENADKLGLVLQSTYQVFEVNGIEIGEGAQAQQALYYATNTTNRNDMITRITVIEFDSVGAARAFIDAWYTPQSYWDYEHIIDLDAEDTLLFEGRFIRSYDSDVALAQNIWQTMNWVTIIETEGIFIDAMTLNKEIREVIVASYKE
jgi:hypothetical protein